MAQAQEFKLIEQYFKWSKASEIVGIGDDSALVELEPGEQLLSCVDTMVCGVHFLQDDDPKALAHKLLAVNLSDIAAMGGVAKWALLSLTLPNIDHSWLKQFSASLHDCAKKNSVSLIGGDTTKGGEIVLSLTLLGTVEQGQAVLRSTAQVDDLIFVTGSLGGAAFALEQKLAGVKADYSALEYPEAQVKSGRILAKVATAMIDISDGLIQDLGHILAASNVGAIIDARKLPFAKTIADKPNKYQYALSGGEDYQLCFTINKSDRLKLKNYDIIATEIGFITKDAQLSIINNPQQTTTKGFRHF